MQSRRRWRERLGLRTARSTASESVESGVPVYGNFSIRMHTSRTVVRGECLHGQTETPRSASRWFAQLGRHTQGLLSILERRMYLT